MTVDPPQREAVRRLARALQEAWNRGDAAQYAALFTVDADLVAWNGLHGNGRAVIEEAHRRLFAGPLAGSRMFLAGSDAEPAQPDSVRFVRPDVAIMVTTSFVQPAAQLGARPEHASVQTFVLVRDAGRWQVAAFHNTRKSGASLPA